MSEQNFLSEVLSAAETVEIEHINTATLKLTHAVNKCKDDVNCFLDSVYVTYSQYPIKNSLLSNKIKTLHEEITNSKENLDNIIKKQLDECDVDLKNHQNTLKENNLMITIVKKLIEIHENVIEIKKLKNQNYVECIKKIQGLYNTINELPQDIEVLNHLKQTIYNEEGDLYDKLTEIFTENVIIEDANSPEISTLKINKNDDLKKILQALYLYNSSITPLDKVARFLWDSVFVPAVTSTIIIEVKQEGSFNVLEVKKKISNHPDYLEVFKNMETILDYLKILKININDDYTVLSYIGSIIAIDFSKLLINNCLQKTIPSTKEGLENYKIIIEATKNLEEKFLESKFFASGSTLLSSYVNNIDELFINKKCQDYLAKAESLMKKDLHDLIEVGVAYDPSKPLEQIDNFPKSSISSSVIELLALVEEILVQSLTTENPNGGRLLYTAQNIFLKYSSFIPEYHQKLLKTIPQQVAVFYNNCCYIDYALMKLNEKYSKKISSIIKLGFDGFKDEGRQLVTIGEEMFNTYVNSQIKQIHEIMKDSGLQNRQTLEKLEPNTEKCLRQCLRQQELLKTVWHKVLPYEIYNKTIGKILNTLCNYLIDSIIKMEDISSNATEELADCIKIITSRGPKLFTDSKEVTLFVSSWYKLNELIFVLNGTMLDIYDRWADGKGPLGLQFTPEELRQLIRALFQNTERRANLLAKIYD